MHNFSFVFDGNLFATIFLRNVTRLAVFFLWGITRPPRIGPGLAQRPEFSRAVFREASSTIIAWSTPAKLARNILGSTRKLLV